MLSSREEAKDLANKVKKDVDRLTEASVLVGVPETENSRQSDNMTNAQLAYLHSNGSPKNNLPARPFLGPGIESNKKQIDARLRKAARASLSGDADESLRQLRSAGQETRDAVKRTLTQGVTPGLSEGTLNSRRTRKSAPRTGTKPLIDTGQLLNSISFVVKKRG